MAAPSGRASEFLAALVAGHRPGGEGGLDLLVARPAAEDVAHPGLQRLEEAVGGFERVDAGGVLARQPFLGAKAEAQRLGVGAIGGVEALEDAVGEFEEFAGFAKAPSPRRAADQRLPGRERFPARRRANRTSGAARDQRGEIVGRGRLGAAGGDRPVEHAVEIELRRLLDAVGRRIGPDADQPLGIATIGGQQPAHPLEEMEGFDDDDLFVVGERVIAIGQIGQMAGEIGDDVAPGLASLASAHVRRYPPVAAAKRPRARGAIISPSARLTSGRTG